MSTRKIENRQIRKLTKSGRGASISLTIPIEIIRKLKWRDNQKVIVKQRGEGVLITDWEE
ncbi:hypothetical protein KKA66_01900 [Patescibacteria group bacterium]|nr:hypothetical protein [Patescibacteria group bacterium]